MFPEIEKFKKHLRRQHPHTSTHYHYISDLRLFFAWANKPPAEITLSDNASYPVGDVDTYIAQCQEQGHAIATINRRLAAISAFYRFLQLNETNPLSNPVIPRRHFTRQGRCLPRKIIIRPGQFPLLSSNASAIQSSMAYCRE